ncbi:MAG: recombinase family protein [Christensenellales bacterium]
MKTPTGKDKWSVSTVTGILTNEKYKGDAHIRKTYVSDYLTKKIIKNKGEVESFYVTKHHEPIIDREEWEIVQDELKEEKNSVQVTVAVVHFQEGYSVVIVGNYTD